MNNAFVFKSKASLGGVQRRIARVYNVICAEHDNLKCDIIVCECDLNTAIAHFAQADSGVTNINHICAFNSRFKSLLYILASHKYGIIHFFGAGKYNIAVQLICKLSRKKSIYTVCNYGEAYNCHPAKRMRKVKLQLRLADHVDLLYPAGVDYISQYVKKGRLTVTPGTAGCQAKCNTLLMTSFGER